MNALPLQSRPGRLAGLISIALLSLCASQAETSVRTWTFDMDPFGIRPKEFVIGRLFDGRPAGEWRVFDSPDAPSPPHVLAQLIGKDAEHAYKVVLVASTEAADLDLEVAFKAIEGRGDMGGGLIWRARDDRNYYLARANPFEQNIRAYVVVGGVRRMLGNANHNIPVDRWHRLRVIVRGDRFQVRYDDHAVLDLRDDTFLSGRIGLWTKSDAVTYFDDLTLRTSLPQPSAERSTAAP